MTTASAQTSGTHSNFVVLTQDQAKALFSPRGKMADYARVAGGIYFSGITVNKVCLPNSLKFRELSFKKDVAMRALRANRAAFNLSETVQQLQQTGATQAKGANLQAEVDELDKQMQAFSGTNLVRPNLLKAWRERSTDKPYKVPFVQFVADRDSIAIILLNKVQDGAIVGETQIEVATSSGYFDAYASADGKFYAAPAGKDGAPGLGDIKLPETKSREQHNSEKQAVEAATTAPAKLASIGDQVANRNAERGQRGGKKAKDAASSQPSA